MTKAMLGCAMFASVPGCGVAQAMGSNFFFGLFTVIFLGAFFGFVVCRFAE